MPVYFNFGLLAFIGIIFPFLGYFLLKEHLDGYWFYYGLASLALFGTGVALFYWLKKGDMKQVFAFTVLFFGFALLTGIPLKKSLRSSTYKPISALRDSIKPNSLKVYGYNVSPEMIWQFGDKIPPIKSEEGSFMLPSDKRLGLLANDVVPEDDTYLKSIYDFELQSVYDLNEVGPSARKYNTRLVNYFYILTKK